VKYLSDDAYAKVRENRRDDVDQQKSSHCYGADDDGLQHHGLILAKIVLPKHLLVIPAEAK
jgi:hypothetical protein